jgi:N-acetylmuramoyl-L-alanine amidase
MNIIQDLIPAGKRNRPGLKLDGPRFITVHDTGNPNRGANAKAHGNYLRGTAASIPASWHFTVDSNEVRQHLPLDEVAWHAGDGNNGPGNRTSIAIEICENADGDRARAERSTQELVADLLRQFNLTFEAVVPHKKWSGKNCPRLLLPRWDAFVAGIRELLVPRGIPIAGPGAINLEQAKAWAEARGAHERFVAVADLYWQEAARYNIAPEKAYAQAAKETGFGHFRGVVPPDCHNWCGLKTRQGGSNTDPNAHARFTNDLTGVRAHLQHLARYAGLPVPDPIVDPRYELVAPGSARTLEELGGKWAPNPDYGVSIVRDYLKSLLATPIPKMDPEEDWKARALAAEDKLARIREIISA